MKEKLVFEEKIYTYHIDFVGHVNNIIYIQWLENGRVKLLEAAGLPAFDLAASEGILPVITETHIRYKKPLYLNNTVTIEIWVSQMFNASLILDFRFLNEKGEVCTVAQQKGLFVDKKTMKPARIKEEYKKAIEKFFVKE
ncbi:acyl-CoA thioester hydrolase [Mariniphaga anaerophila]|uniref:Acyl-CoA thioester hydrolase n=1 Tax=Mariniphaga anaerophila TaxID=1484053 RepID=A0A1M4Y7Q9_9BACT|nr:thioesterase family protein [Mariniphaga anaerophila]SHF01847.1 acyl-CoA thioester hydrolase [Mariniphaga anaerophila]